MKKERKNTALIAVFLIWPFLGLIMATRRFYLKESRRVVYLFLILFGITMVLGDKTKDSFRYAEQFKETAKISTREFLENLSNSNNIDIAKQILNFFISRISNDYMFLFGVIAMIFGFFYLKSITLLYKEYVLNRNRNALFFLLFFIFAINPIFNINGYRFYTATWIFFLGAYQFVLTKNKKYFVLSLLSCLFHFSFILPNIVLLGYYFLGNRKKIYFILFLVSFIVSEYILNFLPNISSYFGSAIELKASQYTTSDMFEIRNLKQGIDGSFGAVYAYIFGKIVFYYIVITIFYVKNKYKKMININTELTSLYSFSLLILAFANTFSFIPSMDRFYTIAYLFSIVFIFRVYTLLPLKKMSFIAKVGVLPLFMILVFSTREGLDLLNPWLFAPTPIPFFFRDVSMYQFLFG